MDVKIKFKNVDQYIDNFTGKSHYRLQKLRMLVKRLIPEAVESISYQMPAFKLNEKPLVYFAAFKNHVGLYPMSGAIKAFKDEIVEYKSATGSIQFPLDKPMPYDLINKIVNFRVKENLNKK